MTFIFALLVYLVIMPLLLFHVYHENVLSTAMYRIESNLVPRVFSAFKIADRRRNRWTRLRS